MRWRRSSLCSGVTNCVEVAELPDAVLVRDAAGRVLEVDRALWREFVAAVRAGRYDG